MFDTLRKVFRPDGGLTRLGHSGESHAFARKFAAANLSFLHLPIADSVAAATATEAELATLVAKAREQTATSQAVTPFTYPGPSNAAEIMPVFTSGEAAEAFVNRYFAGVERITPLAISTVPGSTIIPIFAHGWRIVLNPGAADEYALATADISHLLAFSAAAN